MGAKDEFTSLKQLRRRLLTVHGSKNFTEIIPKVSHFELEGPNFDGHISELIHKFTSTL